MAWEKGWVMWMKWWSTISEVKFITSKVGEARLVKATRRQIHRKSSHFSRTTKERSTTHARELFESALFWSFVLEPDLWNWQDNKTNFSAIFIQIQFSSVFFANFSFFSLLLCRECEQKANHKVVLYERKKKNANPSWSTTLLSRINFRCSFEFSGNLFCCRFKMRIFLRFSCSQEKKRAQAKPINHFSCPTWIVYRWNHRVDLWSAILLSRFHKKCFFSVTMLYMFDMAPLLWLSTKKSFFGNIKNTKLHNKSCKILKPSKQFYELVNDSGFISQKFKRLSVIKIVIFYRIEGSMEGARALFINACGH